VKELEKKLRIGSKARLVDKTAHRCSSSNELVDSLSTDDDDDARSDASSDSYDGNTVVVRHKLKGLQIAVEGALKEHEVAADAGEEHDRGFFGKKSGLHLARKLQKLHSGSAPHDPNSVRVFFVRRLEFLGVPPYLAEGFENTSPFELHWPDPDLAAKLVEAYFSECNSFFPVVHRPTFMRQLSNPEMRCNRAWVSLAFGMFANAAKHLDDPRVLADPHEKYRHSAGASYWTQARFASIATPNVTVTYNPMSQETQQLSCRRDVTHSSSKHSSLYPLSYWDFAVLDISLDVDRSRHATGSRIWPPPKVAQKGKDESIVL
jgi:hypothetical protein